MRRQGTTAGAKQWAERERVRLQVCDGRRPAARLDNRLSQGARRVRRPDRQAAAAQPGDLLQPELHLGASHPSCVSAPRFTPLRSAEGFLSASWRLSNVDRCLHQATSTVCNLPYPRGHGPGDWGLVVILLGAAFGGLYFGGFTYYRSTQPGCAAKPSLPGSFCRIHPRDAPS